MYDTPCPRCQDIGLVRFETVVKGGSKYRAFYCGRCDYTWQSAGVSSEAASRDHADDRPEPSRATKNKSKETIKLYWQHH
jgi:ssDNA-binding Zn-finger/Zn-ribbon topoisomerase 1